MNEPPPAPQEIPARRTCGLAIASLVLGVGSLAISALALCNTDVVSCRDNLVLAMLFCLPAIVAGHVARSQIKKSNMALTGSWSALFGLLFSYLTLGIGILGILNALNATNGDPRSLETARALENGVNNFHTEYGRLPDVPRTMTTDSGEGVRLLNILLGLEDPAGKVENTRMIKFLSAVETKTKHRGLLYSPDGRTAEGLYDSWGNPFTVVLAGQDQETLQFSMGSKTYSLKGRLVAVFSPGADKKPGTSDDVKTW